MNNCLKFLEFFHSSSLAAYLDTLSLFIFMGPFIKQSSHEAMEKHDTVKTLKGNMFL